MLYKCSHFIYLMDLTQQFVYQNTKYHFYRNILKAQYWLTIIFTVAWLIIKLIHLFVRNTLMQCEAILSFMDKLEGSDIPFLINIYEFRSSVILKKIIILLPCVRFHGLVLYQYRIFHSTSLLGFHMNIGSWLLGLYM